MTISTWRYRVTVTVVCALLTAVPARAQNPAAAGSASPVPRSSAVPRAVPFSGQALTANGEARTGTALAVFSLYANQNDDAPLWSEHHVVTLDESGRYSVVLGSFTQDGLPADAFAAGAPRWLGVRIDDDPEQPRFMLLSVPYALKAGDADTVGGRPVSELVLTEKLTDTVKRTLKAEGLAPRPSTPDVSVGKIPKFTTAGGVIDDSIMVESNSRIGINNPTTQWLPYQTFRLDNPSISGSAFTLAATYPGGHHYSFLSTGPAAAVGTGAFAIYDEGAGAYRLVIDSAGRIGIGTPSPSAKLDVLNNAGGAAVYAACSTPGQACRAFWGSASAGNQSGTFSGGLGVFIDTSDSSSNGLWAHTYGSGSIGVSGLSETHYGGFFRSGNNADWAVYVTTQDGPTQAVPGLEVNGAIRAEGNLYVAGSKAGYVVDVMQNVDSTPLEAGDVVVIAGSSEPVLGQIPVVTVRKATDAYETGVAGIVDQVMYAPDAATKAAFEAQVATWEATAAREHTAGRQRAAAPITTISAGDGTLHALPNETLVNSNGYCTVVTLGAFRIVKVDATFGAIHAGDLLTTSTNPGYAMKVIDKVAAIGAIIGKAVGDLQSGTGTIPILVMPK